VNYTSTFIRIASDSHATTAEVPTTRRERKPIHLIQYELITENTYKYTQEDLLWITHTVHKSIPPSEATASARTIFFAKGQPCLRSSPLAKKFGWGFHFDGDGHIALVPTGTAKYNQLAAKKDLLQLAAMRSRRVK